MVYHIVFARETARAITHATRAKKYLTAYYKQEFAIRYVRFFYIFITKISVL